MRILAKTFLLLVACFLGAPGAERVGSAEPSATGGWRPFLSGPKSLPTTIDPSVPFVLVSVPKEPLYLGEVYGPNLQEVGAKVTARVVANCPYYISASFEGLRHERTKVAISPKHLTATVNGKQVPIGNAGRVPIASQGPTPPDGVDVPIDLQVGVKALSLYPAGRYDGTLVITVTAGH